ncbi:hypothetical protein M407DRAFT_78674, partial [Tulasnella calospora MUT 4182]
AGDDEDSEQRHRQALELKIANFGTDSLNTAFGYNALGEALLRKDEFAEAEEVLIKAIVIREAKGPAFNAAVSRENLACVYETQGRWAQAKELRTRNREKMVCSHYKASNPVNSIRASLTICLAVSRDNVLDGRADEM